MSQGTNCGADLAARIDQRFDQSLLGEGTRDVGEFRSDPGATAVELMAPVAARGPRMEEDAFTRVRIGGTVESGEPRVGRIGPQSGVPRGQHTRQESFPVLVLLGRHILEPAAFGSIQRHSAQPAQGFDRHGVLSPDRKLEQTFARLRMVGVDGVEPHDGFGKFSVGGFATPGDGDQGRHLVGRRMIAQRADCFQPQRPVVAVDQLAQPIKREFGVIGAESSQRPPLDLRRRFVVEQDSQHVLFAGHFVGGSAGSAVESFERRQAALEEQPRVGSGLQRGFQVRTQRDESILANPLNGDESYRRLLILQHFGNQRLPRRAQQAAHE